MSEHCVSVVSGMGLIALVWLTVHAHGEVGTLSLPAWFLVASAAVLCLTAGLLAFAAGAWDDRLRRLLRQSRRPVSTTDRWLTLLAAIVLLGGATVEASCFNALINNRSADATKVH